MSLQTVVRAVQWELAITPERQYILILRQGNLLYSFEVSKEKALMMIELFYPTGKALEQEEKATDE